MTCRDRVWFARAAQSPGGPSIMPDGPEGSLSQFDFGILDQLTAIDPDQLSPLALRWHMTLLTLARAAMLVEMQTSSAGRAHTDLSEPLQSTARAEVAARRHGCLASGSPCRARAQTFKE
jgi:hypothetical protein